MARKLANFTAWAAMMSTGRGYNRHQRWRVQDGWLTEDPAGPGHPAVVAVDSPGWFAWLETAASFAFEDPAGHFTARRRRRAGGWYWYAHRRVAGRLRTGYIGKPGAATLERLRESARLLSVRPDDQAPEAAAPRPTPPPWPRPGTRRAGAPASVLRNPGKLAIPGAAAPLVARPRVIRRLARAGAMPLTLVIAPAGFGKTTLLAQLAEERRAAGARVAWVALDEGDGDPARFWAYLLAALDGLAPGVFGAALPLLSGSARADVGIGAVVRLLGAGGDPLFVFLDDYHRLGEQPSRIHAGVVELVTRLPAHVHVVVAGRADPPFPLARLRAERRVLEFGADDLRFDRAETATFLARCMGLDLAERDAAVLEGRTGGWVAGLQLAALALSGRNDHAAWLARFAGVDRPALEFLVDEVLVRLSPAEVSFLASVSLLDRLCAALCAAVTGTSDAGDLLDALVRGRLFLAPLDERGACYRLHPLVRDVLRRRLREAQPRLARALALRASAWSEERGYPRDAIDYAFAAEEPARVAALIEQYAAGALALGRWTTLRGWLRRLPDEFVRARPGLCVVDARLHLLAGRFDAFERRLRDAEGAARSATPEGAPAPPPGPADEIVALRSSAALVRGDLGGCLALCRRALATLPPAHAARSLATLNLGTCQTLGGEPRAASQTLRELLAQSWDRRDAYFTAASGAALAMALLDQGQVRDALTVCRRAARRLDARGVALEGSCVELALGVALYERHDLDGAALHLERAIHLRQPLSVLTYGYVTLAGVRQAQGDASGAHRILDDAVERAAETGAAAWDWITLRLQASQARLWLRQGERASAVRWAHGVERRLTGGHGDDGALPPLLAEDEHLVLARALLADGRAAHALDIAAGVLDAAVAAGRMGHALEALVVEAAALDALGNEPAALVVLRRALELAEPEGAVRAFFELGEPILRLLDRLSAEGRGGPGPLPRIVDALRAGFGRQDARRREAIPGGPPVERGAWPAAETEPPGGPALPPEEPLSEREREVLRLLDAGASNRDLARELVIATGTAKHHVHSILSKLRVRSRLQAVARARLIGLL